MLDVFVGCITCVREICIAGLFLERYSSPDTRNPSAAEYAGKLSVVSADSYLVLIGTMLDDIANKIDRKNRIISQSNSKIVKSFHTQKQQQEVHKNSPKKEMESPRPLKIYYRKLHVLLLYPSGVRYTEIIKSNNSR